MNKVFLMGKLADKPQLKYTASGSAMVSARIMTVSRYQDQAGQTKESKQYHSVSAWTFLAEKLAAEADSGSLVFIEGSLQNSTFVKKDGTRGYKTDVKISMVEVLDKQDKQGRIPAPLQNVETTWPEVTMDELDVPF